MLKNNRGMTMLEVEIAMIAMACILTSSFVFVTNSVEIKSNLKRSATATQIGTDMLEEIRVDQYDSLVQDEAKNKTVVDDYYDLSWIIGDSSYYKTIDLKVAWPKGNHKHSVELSTIVANR